MNGPSDDPLDKLEALARDLADMAPPRSNIGNATINVNAGGIGLWIAVTCCIVCVMACVGMGFLAVYEAQQTSRMQDYLNNIYQQAPWLKPKDHA